jgi:phosphate transport system permease protein
LELPISAVTARPRLWLDRAAGWVVRAGGLAVVLSLVAILVFLVVQTAPLLRGAQVTTGPVYAAAEHGAGALLVDSYVSQLVALRPDGSARVYPLAGGAEQSLFAAEPSVLATSAVPDGGEFALLFADGHVELRAIDWTVSYVDAKRAVLPVAAPALTLSLDPHGERVTAFAARGLPARATAAAVLADGTLVVVRRSAQVNQFSGESTDESHRSSVAAPPGLARLVINPDQTLLYGADTSGGLFVWELGDAEVRGPDRATASSPVTALGLLVGGRSLVAGHADGSLTVWFRVRSGRARTELVRAHAFESQGGPIRELAASGRSRSFLALSEDGALGLYQSTSERTLWRGKAPDGARALAFTSRGDAAFIATPSGVASLALRSLHPEVSLASLFGKVWYEDYPEPAYVWQSTGGSEDAEPKLSLTPLLFGTLKGTLYALFFAIPLGVLGALYTSQVLDARLQRVVKPVVEMMASLPSVVLGFLAGLWLAPRLEHVFPGFLAAVVTGPLLALAAGALYAALPLRFTRRLPTGSEVALSAAALGFGAWACFALSPYLERSLFGGDFSAFLRATTGASYDPRNSIVAGVAMAFAVIPLVFAIAEESLSNVPKPLSAASFALGATRWQTISRVVLPAASPGLFAAMVIGFGRAVGETMIVLMATGNTPLMDWSPFDGFRTLSANIAVEIPEAPQNGTLYRVLFLSALLLFAVTFAANGLADIVRERLRRRYSST